MYVTKFKQLPQMSPCFKLWHMRHAIAHASFHTHLKLQRHAINICITLSKCISDVFCFVNLNSKGFPILMLHKSWLKKMLSSTFNCLFHRRESIFSLLMVYINKASLLRVHIKQLKKRLIFSSDMLNIVLILLPNA